jgi:alpha-L-rhamnosidase
VQFQTYDVTALVQKGENVLCIEVGQGWRKRCREEDGPGGKDGQEPALAAALQLRYADGTEEIIVTHGSANGWNTVPYQWRCRQSKTRLSSIYNGEVVDTTFDPGPVEHETRNVEGLDGLLVPAQGERIAETQRLPVQKIITTPRGETVLDFGQVLTGYVEFFIDGPKGARAVLKHAEILDKQGNLYTENLRGARQEIIFICDGQPHTFKPKFTFMGFRYVRVVDWPGEVRPEDFTAIVVHSEMKRIGHFECSNPELNRLFENVVWGMRGNYLDVPTDCPQRDERLGWTGDAQVFVRTGSYIYDVEKFFSKWLGDLASEQHADGLVPHVIPTVHFCDEGGSTGWGDAAVICPWQIYLTYGSREILLQQWNSMRAWVDYMAARSEDGLWRGGNHFGDWLDLCGENTPNEVSQNAFFAHSTELLIKAGRVLGASVARYETLLQRTKEAFRKAFIKDGKMRCNSQTACVLALCFGLVQGDERASIALQLEELLRARGHLTTGFLGAGHLLHALSENGRTELAYDLLLRREYPSWLYPVTQGATTVWERWDGLRPDGSFQDVGMNSFNHYAYGAVADWLFGDAAGIKTDESAPGFTHIVFEPLTDPRLEHLQASIETRHGLVASAWRKSDDGFVHEFTVPQGCTATVRLGGKELLIGAGTKTITVAPAAD